jgi:hypothetical protein
MESRMGGKSESHPWSMLIWLLIGPLPLFAVLAFQGRPPRAPGLPAIAHHPPVLMTVTESPKPAKDEAGAADSKQSLKVTTGRDKGK